MHKEDVRYIYIHTYTQWNTIQPWKVTTAIVIIIVAICNNMDGAGGYYGKYDKSDRDRQILYDITYMWNLKNKVK